MLDRVLNLPLKLLVVFVAATWLEVYQQTEFIVEGEKLVLLFGIDLELALESHWVTAWGQVSRTTAVAISVLWHVTSDADTVLLRYNIVFVVLLGAVLANDFGLFDVDEYFVWQANMHESIQSAAIFLKQLRILKLIRVINHDHTLLRGRRQSEELDRDLFCDQAILVLCSNHLANFVKERMLEVGIVTLLIGTVVQELWHGDNGHAKVDGESRG